MAGVGVILSQFPRYDEAFILRELVALSQGPYELIIFSLRPCRDRVVHEQAKALLPRTRYAPFVRSARVWRSHAHFLRRKPARYWGALAWIISRHWRHPVILVKTLAFFPKTVHFARVASEQGVSLLHAGWATYPASSALIMYRLTGIPYSLSGHAHDLYTTNPTLAEKIRGARFVVTCTETNQRHVLSLLNDRQAARNWPRSGSRGRETRGGELLEAPSSPRPVTGESRGGHAPRPAPSVLLSYHGVDLARFAAVSKPAGGRCQLLAVGSLLPCKGFETLIEACHVLKSRHVPFHGTIAGGGPLERRLRRLLARHGLLHDVEITGFVNQQVVVRLYQQAHLFVLPLLSRIHWGIPNVLIEALATKTPVICCNLPSLRELVERGESGWIIPEQDPEALATAVTRLWSDGALRCRLAEAGYRRVTERFSLERTGQELRQVFTSALTNGSGGPTTVSTHTVAS